MNKSHLLGAVCACIFALATTTTNAATLDFLIDAPTDGSLHYAGGNGTLIGTNIEVDAIVGLGTPLNPGASITCDNCDLNLNTGNNAGGWTFTGGGTISIDGGVGALGIAANSTLLTGTFSNAEVVDVGGGIFNFKILGAAFIDTKHPDLLAYFGLPLGNYQGGLNISFKTVGNSGLGDSFNSSELLSGNLTNSPVPVPSAVWLFGSGLLGLVGIARRKKT